MAKTEQESPAGTGAAVRRPRDLNLPSPEYGQGGAQARIHSRAVDAANDALRLLERLKVLGAESSPKNVAALKSVMRSEFAELVGELGLGYGPDIERIEQIFSLLLDQLGALQEGIEDEENLTNFRALADGVASLYRSWNNVQQLFAAQTGIASQQFQLVLDAVEEVRSTMDAVLIGPAERQTMMVPFASATGQSGSVSLEELLGWVQDFAGSEGPEAIDRTGGFALRRSVFPAAGRLANLAAGALQARTLADFPKRCSTPPVLRTLRNLAARLDELAWNC